jgi:hypothetical protein
MTLTVIGLGLTSPFGLNATDHVFLGRVVLPAPPPAAFANADDQPLRLYYAPFLDLDMTMGARLAGLAALACDEALPMAGEAPRALPITLALAVPNPRPGLPVGAIDELERALRARLAPGQVRRYPGETGTFAALRDAHAAAGRGASVWVVVSVDSFASPEYLAHRAATEPRNRWIVRRPHPGEAAAVLIVTNPATAGRYRAPVLGHVDGVALAVGGATDTNDEPSDGQALTQALRTVAPPSVRLALGQQGVDALRRRDWCLAAAREGARFRAGWLDDCVEERMGMVGAAVGGASIVQGLSVLRHGAVDIDVPAPHAFVAWAISRDGTRAVAAARAETQGRSAAELVASQVRPTIRSIVLGAAGVEAAAPLEPPKAPAIEDAGAPTSAPHEDVPPSSRRLRDLDAIVEADAAAEDAERAARDAAAWERPPPRGLAPDEDLAPPPVTVKPTGAAQAISPAEFRFRTLVEVLEDITVRARQRVMRPLGDRAEVEVSLVRLADAVHAMGDPIQAVVGWWQTALDPEQPWTSFAAAFALGSFDDAAAVQGLRAGLEAVGSDPEHAQRAAEALALLRSPRERELARDLLLAAGPAARSVGIELMVAAGAFGPEDVAQYAGASDEGALVATAIRAGSRWRAHEAAPLVGLFRRWMRADDRLVALGASLALLRMGDSTPMEELRNAGPLATKLGARALELFVLAGERQDVPLIERIAARAPADERLLSALARFGHPGVWAFLVHQLGDEDLADAAEEALRELLGDAVPPEAAQDAPAWRDAFARARLDPNARYRRGRIWRPSVVASECASGQLASARVDERLAELAARLGLGMGVDLEAWKPDVDAALAPLLQQAHKHDPAFATGWVSFYRSDR